MQLEQTCCPTIHPSIRAAAVNGVLSGSGGGGGTSYLLDDYAGASAAYSMRQLRSDYAGACIRVRRSDSAEQDIGFDSGAIDTTALLAFCGAGNGFVTTWYDQSANARNLTQSTAVSQPQIVSSGAVVVENSLPAMTMSSSSLSVNFGTTLSQPNEMFLVCNKSSGAYVFDGIDATNRNALLRDYNMTFFAGTEVGAGFANADAQRLMTLLFSGASSLARLNGNQTGAGFANTRGLAGLTLGSRYDGTQLMGGTFQEFVFYNSEQSANRSSIEANINDYWGIY